MEKLIYSPSSISFWRAYLIHMRPYLWFISGFAGLTGVAIGMEGQIDYRFFVLLIPFFLAYGFGQALTDCFQIDTDKLSSEYRPLSQGIIDKKDALKVSSIGLVTCGAILIYFNLYNIIFAVLSIAGLATYSFIKKRYWLLGPPYNSLIVALLPLMGFLCYQDTLQLNNEVLYSALVIFLAYNIFVLMGYLKDISADTQAGYNTFTVAWGWDKSVYTSNAFYISLFVLLGLSGWLDENNIIFYILSIILAVYGQYKAHLKKYKYENLAYIPILQSIRVIILSCYTVICYFNFKLLPFLVIMYACFEVLIRNRPKKQQL